MSDRPLRLQAEKASLFDAFLVCLSLIAALVTHKILAHFFNPFATFDMFWGNAWFYIPLVVIWIIVFNSSRLYQEIADTPRLRLFSDIVRLSLCSLAILLAFFYAIRVSNIPRTLLLLQCAYAILFISLRACFLQPILLRHMPPQRILAIGRPTQANRFRHWLAAPRLASHIDLIGYLVPTGDTPPDGFPLAATLDHFPAILRTNVVDTVVIMSDSLPSSLCTNLLHQCATQGIEIWLDAPLLRNTDTTPLLDEINHTPTLIFTVSAKSAFALAIKRALDIITATLALILLAPFLLLIALLIRLTSPGPIFFTQRRCTLHGRTFPMLKFRTMVADAESRRAALEAKNESSGPVFKIKKDPRITPIGRFLRRYSLDEFPQLLNVLAGDMSIVGPRPPIPAEVEKYEDWQRRRLSMRTGCTCLWQIGGRNTLSFDEWMKLDLRYIDTWSLSLDLRILLKTVSTILRGTGC